MAIKSVKKSVKKVSLKVKSPKPKPVKKPAKSLKKKPVKKPIKKQSGGLTEQDIEKAVDAIKQLQLKAQLRMLKEKTKQKGKK